MTQFIPLRLLTVFLPQSGFVQRLFSPVVADLEVVAMSMIAAAFRNRSLLSRITDPERNL